MQLIVMADEVRKEAFLSKKINSDTQLIFIEKISEVSEYDPADAYFLLNEEIYIDHNSFGNKPVFINSTVNTLKDLNLPENISRINGWPGFLNREIWEIAANNEEAVKLILDKLGWKYILVADEPGLISARIISMIINEAYFALGENISTKEEIDIAMKLGTNHPFGPFEWSRKIGLNNVYSLLQKLSESDSRYNIAPAMKKEILNN